MIKVLCVHGVGHLEQNLNWQALWKEAIAREIRDSHPDDNEGIQFQFTAYDDLFAPVVRSLTPRDVLLAVIKLGGGLFPRPSALTDLPDQARWTAGMVVAWVENDNLRDAAWQKFVADVQAFAPDIICAHSLGSLISYDGLRRQENLAKDKTYITLGSQLGNRFVRGAFGGQVKPFTGAAHWFHLFNHHDHVFTAPLDFDAFRTADNFQQVATDFGTDWPWPLNHDAVNPDAPDHAYLTHPQTRAEVWPKVVAAPVPRLLQHAAHIAEQVRDADPPSPFGGDQRLSPRRGSARRLCQRCLPHEFGAPGVPVQGGGYSRRPR